MKLALLTLALLPALHAQPDRFSLPACQTPHQQLADRAFFLTCYDSSVKIPVWTAYELKPDQLHGESLRPSHFHNDPQLPAASASDYKNSGFSRGHMVPAADMAWSDSAIRSTFLLTTK